MFHTKGFIYVHFNCNLSYKLFSSVLYAVLYVRVSCFVVRGCAVSRRYIHVCKCDMFRIVNVYLDHGISDFKEQGMFSTPDSVSPKVFYN